LPASSALAYHDVTLAPRAQLAELQRVGKLVAGNSVQPDDRTSLVERAFRPEHSLHQARLRPGEHVADVSLMLDRRPQRVLHRSAIEAGNRLKLVEGHDDLAAAGARETRRQREHFLGEA
jgi:hypothetical protein